MPAISVKAIGVTDPPPMIGRPIIGHVPAETIEMFVLNGGMQSGDPSIAMAVPMSLPVTFKRTSGFVVIETSLAVLLAAAAAAKAIAETQFGWEQRP